MGENTTSDQAATTPLAASGAGADSKFADEPSADPVKPCQKKTWVAIELKDNQGNPVPNESYKIELPDGRMVTGALDAMGTAGVDGIDPGTCNISFPNLDAKSWSKA